MSGVWFSFATLPPNYKQVELQVGVKHVILGWRVADSWLTWSDEGSVPSSYTSSWQKAGVAFVKPTAWRPHVREIVSVAEDDVIALREVDVIVRRSILTDGTLRRVKQGNIRSSWDSSWHVSSGNVGDYVGFDTETPMPRWRPEAFDLDNYLIGMGWFTALGKPGQTEITREQEMIVLRSYGQSYETVGERFSVSKQRCRDVYWKGIERIWDRAKGEAHLVRRLPRSLWARDAQFAG